MNILEIIILAFALSIDCLLVSFSQGLILNQNKIKNAMRINTTMGFFHSLMTIIGYSSIKFFHNAIEPYCHWIIFSIFMILGLKFIAEALLPKKQPIICIGKRCLFSIGIATSIDSLFAGLSINLTHTPLLTPTLIIGLTAFTMSTLGFNLGQSIKKIPAKSFEILGGLILILLGIKSFF